MTTERMQRTYELFEQALERPPEQRSAFLIEACGDDAKLRTEVESLLEHDGQASDGFMRPPEHVAGVTVLARPGQAAQPHEASSAPRPPGPLIEGYEIIKELHRGGQGAVYQAIQKSTKRTVALKLLLQGPYASPRQRHRFEREIDLVAGLQHPHIVTVYDSGVTRDDRHYFAMEYIHGQSLNVYLSDKDLSIDETLRLFQKICAAVNYAHQRGVIHRDLKPGNIRIDANGEPHILDFGLAKSAGAGLTDGLPVSVTGEFMGTLAYASPEQTKGDPNLIDIRTDVYSLGVILYEMLTGKYPYPVAGQMAEVFRNIAEAEPMKPSTIRRQINDEVETIVLKALAKEKERRYQSAENLARDVEHYLGGEAIEAKRDSTWYVIRKSLRRYRLAVAVAAAFVLLLGGSTIALSIMYQNQSRAREQAELARDQTQIVADFQSSMLAETDAEGMGLAIVDGFEDRIRAALGERIEDQGELDRVMHEWRQRTLKAGPTTVALAVLNEFVLAKATEAIEKDFADQPLVRAALQQTVATTYREIGLYPPTIPLQEAALETRRHILGDDHPDTLGSIHNMGLLLDCQGKLAEAEPYLREALEGRRRVLGDDHPDTLYSINSMGVLLRSMGKLADAEPYYREALEGRRRVLGDDHPDTLRSIGGMGSMLKSMGKLAEAEPYYREALEGKRRVLGDDHPDTLRSIGKMGGLLWSMGKLADAEPYYREALEGFRRVRGDDHPDTLTSIARLGPVFSLMGKPSETEACYGESLEGRRRVLGDDHPDTLRSIGLMGGVLESKGKLSEAESYYREALEGFRRVLGDDHPNTLVSILYMGGVLKSMGKLSEAEPYYREALEGLRRVRGNDHPTTLGSILNMGHLLLEMGKQEEAMRYYREALEGNRRVLGDDHPSTLRSIMGMGRLLLEMGKVGEAEALFADAVAAAGRLLPEGQLLGTVFLVHGLCLTELERYAEAETALLEAHWVLEASVGAQHEATIMVIRVLTDLYAAWHGAEPDQGYDAEAATWRAKLEQ